MSEMKKIELKSLELKICSECSVYFGKHSVVDECDECHQPERDVGICYCVLYSPF